MNPQGDKDFKRPVPIYGKIRIPYEAEPEDFTYEELELVNLVEPGEYRVTMNDRSKVLLTVVIHRNEHTQAPEILEFVSPMGYAADRRHGMPPFADMLREMLGDKARQVATMEERRRWVEQKKVPVSVGV